MQLVRAGSGVRVEPQGAPDEGLPRVDMLAAGVCGTDLQIAARQRDDVASVLGHEGVGVLRPASGPPRLVVFNPVDPRDQDAILGHSYDGVFRSWVPVGERPGRSALLPVAPLEPIGLLTLCEPLATVLFSWELIGSARRRLAVGVWGAGPLGLLHAGVAAAGGHDVALVHPDPRRLEWAATQPFGEGLRFSAAGTGELRALDVAIMCASRRGIATAVGEAAAALVPGGLMVLAAGLGPAPARETFVDPSVGRVRRRNVCGRVDARGTIRATTASGKPVQVTGHRGTSLRQLAAAERTLRADPTRFLGLITHTVGPERAAVLINARCSGASRDEQGSEIVKIVIELGAADA